MIIPSYNHAEYLHQTIESALTQDYPDVEVIVADDASTDNSVEVARAFGDRIRLLELSHGDISATRNRAILASTGEFVAFLDCDDIYLRSRISATVAALNEHPEAVLAFCESRFIDSAGNDLGPAPHIRTGYDPASLEALFWSCRLYCLCVTARKQEVIEAGLFDPQYDTGCEDYDLWLRLRRRYPFVYVPQELSLHRRHSTNTGSRRIFTTIRNERQLIEGLANDYPQFRPWLPSRRAHLALAEGIQHLMHGQYAQFLNCCLQALGHSPRGAVGYAFHILVRLVPRRIRRLAKARSPKVSHRS